MIVQVPESVLRLAIECIARAESQGAFKDCVVPRIGEKTIAAMIACIDGNGRGNEIPH